MMRACLICLALVMAMSACSKRHTRGGGMGRDAGPRADTGPVPPGEDGGIVIMFDAGPPGRRDSGPPPGTDAGPSTTCSGDRFDMAACNAADSACSYGLDCPEAMFPPYDECFSLLHGQFAMGRSSAPDLIACSECLEAFDRAFDRFAAAGVCPPPMDPPPDVAAECDSDLAADADGDGNPMNDIDVCGF